MNKNIENRIVFVAKTDLNTDGRILNEINILKNKFKNIIIDFILLEDKPYVETDIMKFIHVHKINCSFRNNKFLRLFTIFQWTFKAMRMMINLSPQVVHTQDSAAVLPVLIYSFFSKKRFYLIYDDHEIPNENESYLSRINNYFERVILKRSNKIVFANSERMTIVKSDLKLREDQCTYLLNLPYFASNEENEIFKFDDRLKKLYDNLRNDFEHGCKFIIHQGIIDEERGAEYLAKFSKILPLGFKILLLGGSLEKVKLFYDKYEVDQDNFIFGGSIPYRYLGHFWNFGCASIIIYLPTYINNRLCAPNRLYISLDKGIPVIVNVENPVLKNFVENYDCGYFIDNFKKEDFNLLGKNDSLKIQMAFNKLKTEQINNFIRIYEPLF